MKHRWGEPVTFPFKTERECLNGCRTIKVTRHESEGGHAVAWREFWRDGEQLPGERTPACEAVKLETTT